MVVNVENGDAGSNNNNSDDSKSNISGDAGAGEGDESKEPAAAAAAAVTTAGAVAKLEGPPSAEEAQTVDKKNDNENVGSVDQQQQATLSTTTAATPTPPTTVSSSTAEIVGASVAAAMASTGTSEPTDVVRIVSSDRPDNAQLEPANGGADSNDAMDVDDTTNGTVVKNENIEQGGSVLVKMDEEAVVGGGGAAVGALGGGDGGDDGGASDPFKKNVGGMRLQNKWEEMFNRLVAYKEKHGDCLVPNRYPEDAQLGSWVSTQRRHYKILNSTGGESTPMTPARARRLEAVGFKWSTKDPRHVPWEKRFNELVDFRKKFGHCQVPIGWEENIQLSNWVSTQRQEYKLIQRGRQSRLTNDRIRLLNDIDFVWEAQRGGPRRKRKATVAVPARANPVEQTRQRASTAGAAAVLPLIRSDNVSVVSGTDEGTAAKAPNGAAAMATSGAQQQTQQQAAVMAGAAAPGVIPAAAAAAAAAGQWQMLSNGAFQQPVQQMAMAAGMNPSMFPMAAQWPVGAPAGFQFGMMPVWSGVATGQQQQQQQQQQAQPQQPKEEQQEKKEEQQPEKKEQQEQGQQQHEPEENAQEPQQQQKPSEDVTTSKPDEDLDSSKHEAAASAAEKDGNLAAENSESVKEEKNKTESGEEEACK